MIAAAVSDIMMSAPRTAVALKTSAEAAEKNLAQEIASMSNKLSAERSYLQQQQEECSRLWNENKDLRRDHEQGLKDLQVRRQRQRCHGGGRVL